MTSRYCLPAQWWSETLSSVVNSASCGVWELGVWGLSVAILNVATGRVGWGVMWWYCFV